MNQDEAKRLHDALTIELAEVEERRNYFAVRASAIRKVIEGVVELFPELLTVAKPGGNSQLTIGTVKISSPTKVKGRDLLRTAMGDDTSRWYSATEVLEALALVSIEIGGENPDALIRKWLRQALAHKMVERRRRDGRTLEYRWLAPGELPAVVPGEDDGEDQEAAS